MSFLSKYAKTRSPYEPNKGPVWAKLWLKRFDALGRDNVRLPLPMRVYLIALGRVGSNGHSPLVQGDLDLANADGVVYSARAVQKAIRTLVEAQLLAPSSSRRCLVLPTEHIDYSVHSGQRCPECKHDLRWTVREGGEWTHSLVAWEPKAG